MGKKYLKTALTALLALLIYAPAFGQGASDVLRYSQQYPGYDAVSLVMPGVSDATGFGAYQENPASMAFFDQSFMSLGLSGRYVDEQTSYLGNSSSFDDSQLGISDAGFVFNVPTTRGKLTIGGGYSFTHDFNRALANNARNNLSTITDFYAGLPITDPLNEAAFNAFAIDDVEENGETYSLSILRFLPPGQQYPGINQRFEITEEGQMGEYSAFVATEFFKDLVVGISIGAITGDYHYRRTFLEVDAQGDYDDDFIETEDGLTDVDRIRTEDRIDVTFSGFSARVGAIYEVSPQFNIGASYHFRNTIHIEDDYSTNIRTTMDNGVSFSGEDEGFFKYKVRRPARLNLGVTARNIDGFTISASAERVNYSEGRIEFEELEYDDLEDQENSIVRSSLEDVYNLRLGIEYTLANQFTPRIGYAYYPSPTGDFESDELNGDRQFYSAGFTARISDHTSINLGAQLGTWDDRNTLYTTPEVSESATEEVRHWNIMGGVTFTF